MSADPHPTPSSQSLADFRLHFSPSYVLVGVYRLSTDPSVRVPTWKKCKHGFVRGVLVGSVWVSTRSDRHRRTARPTPFPRRVVPTGVFHVRNSKEPHSTLPVKVRSILVTYHSIHSHPHARSARVTGLSHHSFFGYTAPFELTTCMRLLLPYPTSILTLRFLHPPSGCSACRRGSSQHHPQLLSSKECSHCQEASMGAHRCLEG